MIRKEDVIGDDLKECACCGKLTSNPRFCSRSCAAKTTNKESPKRKITTKCTRCDNLVRNYRSTLCTSCFEQRKLRFKNELTIGEYRTKQSVAGRHGTARISWKGFA